MTNRTLILSAIAFSFSFFLAITSGSAQTHIAEIKRLTALIAADQSADRRAENAETLAMLLKRAADERQLHTIDNATIDAIASLLRDKSDAVRMWVAGGLGFFGPRANSAVPALQQALHEVYLVERANSAPVTFGVNSRDAIETALERITGHRPTTADP